MDNLRILIVGSQKIYGPFLPQQATNMTDGKSAQDVAQTWLDNHPEVTRTENPQLYSFWGESVQTATADQAHECGNRLQSIEEASQSRTGKRASGA